MWQQEYISWAHIAFVRGDIFHFIVAGISEITKCDTAVLWQY